ncbi:MAG: sigma 54-interacting transcriptional regulator [Acidobacteriota bacterium]
MLNKEKLDEDLVLRAIVEGTATVTGADFFRSLVYHLAAALQVRFAFVAEFADVNTRVRTLAYWGGDRFFDNVEFDLNGTPCEEVVAGAGSLCHHHQGVQMLFPKDRPLAELGVESYLGVPLCDSIGKVLGHLAALDTKPMPPEPCCLYIFKIFAGRASAELERIRAEKVLQESEQRLASILTSTMDAIITVNNNGYIRIFNTAAEKIFRCYACEAIDKPFNRFFSERFCNVLNGYIKSFDEGSETRPYMWMPEGLKALRTDGEEFLLEATVSQVKVAGERLYTIILRDINELKQAEAEIEKLHLENLYLQEEIKAEYNFEEIIGACPAIRKVFQNAEQVATTDSTVLVVGETGTGKELIARAIHNRSKRKNRPLIKVNCAALSPGLIESEFFGHEKGAFTGAISQRIGRFELADGGTIFLDEIGDISLEVQAKLLRVLQEQEFERVGGSRTQKVNVRVIAATNRDLKKAVEEGRFRADLYYRLNVFPVQLPPLRARKEDIPLLVRYFVSKHMARMGKQITKIDQRTIERLSAYDWPGNIRELENVVERAVILSTGAVLEIEDELLLASLPDNSEKRLKTMEEIERDHIVQVLEQVGWVIEGSKGAATILDLNPNTLRSRMAKLNIQRPRRNIS